MSASLPPLPNDRAASAISGFIADMDRALDLTTLEPHFRCAGAHLAALSDVQTISGAILQGCNLVLDRLYHEHSRRLCCDAPHPWLLLFPESYCSA